MRLGHLPLHRDPRAHRDDVRVVAARVHDPGYQTFGKLLQLGIEVSDTPSTATPTATLTRTRTPTPTPTRTPTHLTRTRDPHTPPAARGASICRWC